MAENNGGSDDLKPISVDGVVNGEVRSDKEKQASRRLPVMICVVVQNKSVNVV